MNRALFIGSLALGADCAQETRAQILLQTRTTASTQKYTGLNITLETGCNRRRHYAYATTTLSGATGQGPNTSYLGPFMRSCRPTM